MEITIKIVVQDKVMNIIILMGGASSQKNYHNLSNYRLWEVVIKFKTLKKYLVKIRV